MVKFAIFISEWWIKIITKIANSLEEESTQRRILKEKKQELYTNICKIKELINDKRIDKNIGSSPSERSSFYAHNE